MALKKSSKASGSASVAPKSTAKAPKKAAKAAMGKDSKPARSAAPRKAALARGVEPITEGPYANSGPEGAARLAKGAEKGPEATKAILVSPGAVTV